MVYTQQRARRRRNMGAVPHGYRLPRQLHLSLQSLKLCHLAIYYSAPKRFGVYCLAVRT